MKIKQTILALGVLVALVGSWVVTSPTPAWAAKCGGVDTSIINCSSGGGKSSDVSNNAIWQVLVDILNIMIAGVGILAIAGIVYASVLYASAGDSTEQVKKAKTIITNVVIGLVAFGLMYAVLNYLMPGGLFHA